MYLESTNKKKYNKKMKILEHICGFDEHTFIKNTVVWRRASSSIFSLFLQSMKAFWLITLMQMMLIVNYHVSGSPNMVFTVGRSGQNRLLL